MKIAVRAYTFPFAWLGSGFSKFAFPVPEKKQSNVDSLNQKSNPTRLRFWRRLLPTRFYAKSADCEGGITFGIGPTISDELTPLQDATRKHTPYWTSFFLDRMQSNPSRVHGRQELRPVLLFRVRVVPVGFHSRFKPPLHSMKFMFPTAKTESKDKKPTLPG